MRQALLVETMRFEVREVARPVPARDEVLIAVEAAGICGSDLHTYHGANPVIRLPVVVGHECAGRVVEGGTDQGLKPGMVVAVEPDAPCGECAYCRAGQTHLCDAMRFVGGLTYDGAFAEYIIAPVRSAVPLPEHVLAKALGPVCRGPVSSSHRAWIAAHCEPLVRRPARLVTSATVRLDLIQVTLLV